MAHELKLLYLGGVKNSLDSLEAAAFTVDNRVGNVQKVANTSLDANTPKGLLAGSIVSQKGSRVVGGCNGTTEQPLGFLLNNVAGNPFENTPAVASGKGPYVCGEGTEIEINTYETRNAANTLDLAYTVGALVYASQNGLVSTEVPFVGARPVGLVKKTITAADPFLGLQLLI